MRTMSGLSSAARRAAASPSTASPTTSMSSWASRSARNPARTSPWSSASTTRINDDASPIGSFGPHRGPSSATANSRHSSGTPLRACSTQVVELDARSGHEVPHRARHHHVAGRAGRRHSSADADGDPADVVPAQLDLAGVKPDPDVDAHGSEAFSDGDRAADGAGGGVEEREEAVSGRLDLASSVVSDLPCESARRGGRGQSRQRRSPISAARSVDETMSLNITVARIRSAVEPDGNAGASPSGERADQPPGDAGGEERVPPGDRPHAMEEHLRLRVLDEEAAGPHPERLEHVLVDVERGEDHDPSAIELHRSARSFALPPARPSPASGCPSGRRRERAPRPSAGRLGRRRPRRRPRCPTARRAAL